MTMFRLGGSFPYFSVFPNQECPIFKKVEMKIEKLCRRYFVIDFLNDSPIDLPFIFLNSNPSQTPFSKGSRAKKALKEIKGDALIDHEDLHTEHLFRLAGFHFLGNNPAVSRTKGKQESHSAARTKGSQKSPAKEVHAE
ncbi:unnamed protein product [Cuscuta campestris]|uniref:Uncharacterized protein n=1 Tax=Cuscuta campestris TaxID=132261 RepID=A0A484L3U5_9ASTE|nr:unnamed protein product [Cuscuta campestris]